MESFRTFAPSQVCTRLFMNLVTWIVLETAEHFDFDENQPKLRDAIEKDWKLYMMRPGAAAPAAEHWSSTTRIDGVGEEWLPDKIKWLDNLQTDFLSYFQEWSRSGREQAGLSASDRFQTGFRPVSDRFQTSVRPVSDQCHAGCTVHVTVSPPHPHAQSMSPCQVRCTVSCRMHSLDINSGKQPESGPMLVRKRSVDV